MVDLSRTEGSAEMYTKPSNILINPKAKGRRAKNTKTQQPAQKKTAIAVESSFPEVHRDIWAEVYHHLGLQDAARLATVDKFTLKTFKQRFELEQVRLKSVAEACFPVPLQSALFHVIRCGLQKARVLDLEPTWMPVWYAVNMLGHVRLLDPSVTFNEKVCVLRHICGHVVCYVNLAPGEDVVMDIRWGKCRVETSKSINPERAMGFLLLILDTIQRVGENDESNPVGSLAITHVCINIELLAVGVTNRTQFSLFQCHSSPSVVSSIQAVLFPILPCIRFLTSESYPKYNRKLGFRPLLASRQDSGEWAIVHDNPKEIQHLKVKVYCRHVRKSVRFMQNGLYILV